MSLLRGESFNLVLKEDLKPLLEVSSGSTDVRTVGWEASKAFVRGLRVLSGKCSHAR